jgi:hypothetical protein
LITLDALVLLAVTLIGFVTHSSSLAAGRWLTTFLPLFIAWIAIAPWFGLYSPGIADRPIEFWRALIAAAFAAPLAVLLRGIWLNAAIIPIFGLVMLAVSAAGMGIWRLIWAGITIRKT